jgi:hypothetical protein
MMGIGGTMLVRAKRTVNPAAVSFLAGGLLCFAMGNLFYVLHYVLLGKINRSFSASDIAWIGAYLFIIGAHQLLVWEKRKASWRPRLFVSAVLAVFTILIILYGNAAVNILWAVPLCLLAWFCGKGMDAAGKEKGKERLRPYYFLVLLFIAAECTLFLAWDGGYVVTDGVLTAVTAAMGIVFYRENRAGCI